jgi:beta-glucosidase
MAGTSPLSPLRIALVGLPLVTAVAASGAGGACDARLAFDPRAVAGHRMLDGAGPGFLLGVATSPHQIEGGTANDWTVWERGSYPDGSPHVVDGATAARAADSWNLWRRDIEAVDALGANVYRLGVEWSRLEPRERDDGSGRGAWDAAAAVRYREMLSEMVRPRQGRPRGIRPMLNLFHFTLPPWVAARGGWEWPGAPAAFAAFASRVAAELGDLVDLWCTLNEPNVFAVKGYLAGQWPPGVRDPRRGSAVMAALLRGHGLATAAIRAADRVDADGDGAATSVGLAHNVRIFDPVSRASPADALVAAVADHFYNHTVPDAVATGRIRIAIPTAVAIDEAAPELRGSFDWLGLNYYTRDRVRARLGRAGAPYESVLDPALARSDMGWEIYPEGLYRLLVRFAAYGWPIIVTESGVADRRGDVRPGFIRSHVYALDRARADGVDVRGYLHWSLLDNFEWSHGYRGRFGLYTVDFDADPTLARRPTPAVATFQELARNLGLLPPR